MVENGGPVFEGVGRPEVQSKNIVDHIKDRWKKNVNKNSQDLLEKSLKKAEFKGLGKAVEQKYLDAFDRVTQALDEGKLRTVAEKLRPIAKLEAKLLRVSTAVIDVTVAAIPTVVGLRFYTAGIGGLSSEVSGGKKYSAAPVLGALGIGGAGMALGTGIMDLSPARRTSMWVMEKGGNLGERVAKWTNKILHKDSKPEVKTV